MIPIRLAKNFLHNFVIAILHVHETKNLIKVAAINYEISRILMNSFVWSFVWGH